MKAISSQVAAVLADVVPALRALVVALVGVLVALSWFRGQWVLSGVLLVTLGALGVAVELVGDRFLPRRPLAAALVMEWWILLPMAVAAAASAALIVLAVELAVPESVTDPAVKETTGAIASGLSTFLTAAFVSGISDRDKSAVGDRIKARFRSHYARTVPPREKRIYQVGAGSDVEQLLYSDFYQGLSGWDRETRITRAKRIAEKLNAAPVSSGYRP